MAYATIDDLTLRYGTNNLTMWAAIDGNNSDPLISQRWQSALDWATSQINTLLIRGGYAIPLQFLDPYAQSVVNDWCVHIAAWRIYEARGHNDEDKTYNKLNDARKMAIAEIMKVRSGTVQFNCARRWSDNPTAPTVV